MALECLPITSLGSARRNEEDCSLPPTRSQLVEEKTKPQRTKAQTVKKQTTRGQGEGRTLGKSLGSSRGRVSQWE